MGFVICVESKEKYAIHKLVFAHKKTEKNKCRKSDKWIQDLKRHVFK